MVIFVFISAMAFNFKDLFSSFHSKMSTISCSMKNAFAGGVLFSFLHAYRTYEIMEADSNDPVLEIDQPQEPIGETKLPNAHSAALVMGLIALCVVSYCVYRVIKQKCCPKIHLSVAEDQNSNEGDNTRDSVMKQREDYLAIYGPKKIINSVSGAISKNERTECALASSRQN